MPYLSSACGLRGALGVFSLRSIIHIVDDDPSFRTAVGRLLREAGYEILAYELAQQLLERLACDSVSGCILLDVQIPGPERARIARPID